MTDFNQSDEKLGQLTKGGEISGKTSDVSVPSAQEIIKELHAETNAIIQQIKDESQLRHDSITRLAADGETLQFLSGKTGEQIRDGLVGYAGGKGVDQISGSANNSLDATLKMAKRRGIDPIELISAIGARPGSGGKFTTGVLGERLTPDAKKGPSRY